MAITLQKGQGVSLRKESGYDLSRLTVGLGWDIAPSTPAYDLDAVAFLLDGDGKVRNSPLVLPLWLSPERRTLPLG